MKICIFSNSATNIVQTYRIKLFLGKLRIRHETSSIHKKFFIMTILTTHILIPNAAVRSSPIIERIKPNENELIFIDPPEETWIVQIADTYPVRRLCLFILFFPLLIEHNKIIRIIFGDKLSVFSLSFSVDYNWMNRGRRGESRPSSHWPNRNVRVLHCKTKMYVSRVSIARVPITPKIDSVD